MGEFFRGWRRTVGTVTLVLALASTGGWIRSLAVMDAVEFYCGNHTKNTVVSVAQLVAWERSHRKKPHDILSLPTWQTSKDVDISGLINDDDIKWYWRGYGFAIGVMPEDKQHAARVTCWIVPYWSIAIPLAGLSTILLLSKKSRSSNQKTMEPVRETPAQIS